MKYTISQAIVAVFDKERRIMSAQEIYAGIVKHSFYDFKSKNPVSIISTEIRRHCKGNPQSANRIILFVKTNHGKYWLSNTPEPK